MKIAKTTLGSKILAHHNQHFASLAVDAVMRLKSSGNLDAIQVIKKLGGSLQDSYLDEGHYFAFVNSKFILCFYRLEFLYDGTSA